MLDGFKLANRAADLCRLDPHQHSHANSRQHVLNVVRALQRDLADRHDLALGPPIAPDNALPANESSALHLPQATEPGHRSLGFRSHRDARRIVCIQYREIVSRLVLENAGLRGGVVLKCVVPVEMIWGDVEDNRNLRMEALDGFQLEAANLQHNPGVVGGSLDEADRWSANVAPHQRLPPASSDDLSCQRGGRGLTVRTGDRYDVALQIAC